MKNIIFLTIVMALVLVSCNQRSNQTTNDQTHRMNGDRMMMDHDSTMRRDNTNTMGAHEKMYACPMHPEIKGKKNAECSICGMELTEPVPDEEQ